MSRGRTIAVLSILALVVGIVLGALPVQAARGDGGVKTSPATNVGINYPAFPTTNSGPTPYPSLTAGPYIVAATARPASVTGGTADVLLVFNENIAGGSVDATASGAGGTGNADIWVYGFTFTGVTVSANTIALTGAVGAGTGDQVRLATSQAIAGIDGSLSSDVSPITIGTGPVITSIVFVAGYGDSLVDNDSLLVTFDANVAFGSGDGAGTAFWQTPEFAMTAANTPASMLNATVAANTIALGVNDNGGNPNNHHFRFIEAGVSKLYLDAAKVAWTAVATENSQALLMPIAPPPGNSAPYVRAVYYNTLGGGGTSDDEIWVVMSAPINPLSFGTTIETSFNTDVDGGGFAIPAGIGTISSTALNDFTSVLKLTGLPVGLTLPTTSDLLSARAGTLLNYQGVGAMVAAEPVLRGIGIIRASFDDRRTTTRTDDQLYIWLNETVSTAANIGIGDFVYSGFNSTGLTLTTDVVGTSQRITISGFTTANYPRPGSRIRAVAGSGIVGAVSGEELSGGATAPMILVEDESRPYALQMVENDALTYDRWNAAIGVDSVFVAWAETNADDSDQYFAFVTKENPGLVDAAWMNSHLPAAIALGNLRPNTVDGLIRVGFLIDPTESPAYPGAITQSVDGSSPDLAVGDQLYVLVASADYQGNLSLRFDQGSLANHIFGAFLVGPLCQPRDFISNLSVPADPDSNDWDDDVIHVVGDSTATGIAYFVYGDPGAVPCSADSIVAYRVANSILAADWLGSAPVAGDGSFSYMALNSAKFLTNQSHIYLRTKTGVDVSDPTAIILDLVYPYVRADVTTSFPDYIFDPWNPYRIYNAGDYVNLRLLATDGYNSDPADGVEFPNAKSALLHIWADFSRLDLTAGNISGFGTPSDSLELTSLGADLVDNDGDWRKYTDTNGNGTYDVGEPINDDKGLDGLGPADPGYPGRDRGEGDGLPTFGDPYVDENGNGVFDAGETFVDRVNKPTGGAFALRDPGEPNLDSQDPQEFGWYELRNSTSGTRGTIKQGYLLANPNPDARLWPQVPVKLSLEDNGIGRTGNLPLMPGYVERALPFADGSGANTKPQGFVRTMSHVTTHLGTDAAPWDPERSFLAHIDLQPPTVAEVTRLEKQSSSGSTSTVNEIVPGNPVYHLGRFVDFTVSTLSDWDVLYNRGQLKVGSTWRDLDLDPSPASGAASDGNGDAYPGARFYDEDADSTAQRADGFDNDGDGQIDEIGEGIDFSDGQVFSATQDSTQDNANASGTGLHCMNDRRDNDNDAFFVYDSYAGGGLAGVGNIGKITWYNIDESTTNNFDDNNDGVVDDAGEAPENVGYGTGANDDNEDGIADGEAVAIPINNAFSKLAGLEALANGVGNFLPAFANVGQVPANTIFVDAARIFGTRPLAGNNANTSPFYFNNTAYTEPIAKAFNILTVSDRLFPTGGYDLEGKTDSTATQQFNWFAMHANQNLDMELIQKIHGLTADGTTQYQLRTLAYDKSGNMATAWTEPISFTIDLTGPTAQIPGCVDDPNPAIPGFPPDFEDVSATLPGLQIWDSGKHPGRYTLTVTDATNASDAAQVYFVTAPSLDSLAIYAANPGVVHTNRAVSDLTAPFTAEWPFAAAGMFSMDNYPYNHQQTWYFAAVGVDAFGNATPAANLCVFEATVLDGTAPIVCLAQVDNDADLRDGATAPPDSSINVYVYQQVDPLPGRFDDADGITWVCGLDRKTGVAGFDDDNDGQIDEDDVNGNGIYDPGIDNAGVDGVPGNNDDEWNGSANAVGGSDLGETDDYRTNDIVKVVFQMNPVGDNPDMGWITFATVHGDTNTVHGQVVDWTEPVKATWNTWGLATGDYNLRAYGVDWEGNSNELTACITTVGIRSNPLRAYIQPEVCTGGLTFDLYAVHYIHDYEINKVRFEYYQDTNNDGCANDGNAWTLIGIDDNTSQDPRGDAVLYPPGNQIPNNDTIQSLTYHTFFAAPDTLYWFYDPDHDGYSPRDPVIKDGGATVNGKRIFQGLPADTIVIGADAVIPPNAELTSFASDEFWADAAGETDGLEPTDWIFRQNRLNTDEAIGTGLNRWTISWDATGLPEGNYLVRSIAIDENNLTDVITYTCYSPEQQNPPEIELVQVDTRLPDTNITTLTLPDGTSIDVSAMAVPPYINGNTKWIKITATGDADVAKMRFDYSVTGGVTWTEIDVNNDDDFYADVDGTPGFQADGSDEIFNDMNGNFTYDPGVDFVRYDGGDGVVDTPPGWPLIPLVGEDGNDSVDNDHDGQVDEDPPVGTVQTPTSTRPGNPEDYTSPFYVYLDISSLTLMSDVNILFKATAYDLVCNDIYRPDETPDILPVIIGENQQPEADVIRVQDLNGNELDTRPAIMDGDGVDTFGADLDTARVYVTAEDVSSIVSVDLFYRLDPACYTSIPEDQQKRPVDLALVLDGSASINAASFALQLQGVATALQDPSIIPADGTVAFTLVQFGNDTAVTEIPLTVISSAAVAATLATQVGTIVQLMDGTPTALAIDRAVEAIGAGHAGAQKVIIIATDGQPSFPPPDAAAAAAALAAADNAVAAGIDEIHALGIGGSVDMTFLGQLVRHGNAEQIANYTEFASAIGTKVRDVIFNSLLSLRQWRSMSLAGLTRVDTTYPYDFNVATDLIPDGVYQYYPRAYDANGTFNEPPVNPWGFKKFAQAGVNFAFVCAPTEVPVFPDTAAVGDEFVIHGCLLDPAQAATTAMRFYYAPRIIDEVIDATAVQPLAPFMSAALSHAVLGGATGDGVVLTINGTVGTYHSSLAGLAAPTALDFTLVGDQVVFGARPANSDVILVSYDFGSWTQIGTGDFWSPYTVAWSQVDGGIPAPADPATNAYDIIAVALFDLNGDGIYNTGCDFTEGFASEGNYLFLQDEARPKVILYGLAFHDFAEPFDYLDWNWPGNPLFRSGDELGGPNYENKLSGIETDVFVKATDSGGGSVASVKLDITETDVAGGTTVTSTVDMTEVTSGTTMPLPITFYEDDYYSFWVSGTGIVAKQAGKTLNTWESAAIENVVLQISLDHGATWTREYQMVRDAATRSWSAVGRFDIGITDSDTQRYQFIVDLVGNQQEAVPDLRNAGPLINKQAPFFSALNVPSLPFWYTHLDDATQLRNNAFHRVVVTATDTSGNTGSNLTSLMPGEDTAQGPIVFVLDQTPPVVNSITVLNADFQPVVSSPLPRTSPSGAYKLMANVSDFPFSDINVQAVRGVIYQYTPNAGQTWVTIGVGSALNGQWVIDWTPPNTLGDGFDNDGDGLFDEADEAIADLTIRAIAFDDGLNTGFSDRQTPVVTVVVTVDSAEPTAALDHPLDGEVFGYSDSILLSGTAHGDYLPPKATDDVDIVRFQAKINRYYYIDETVQVAKNDIVIPSFQVVGKPDVYENGLDEVWWDKDDDGAFSPADSCLYGGADGQCFVFPPDKVLPTANFWFDLDPTPQDNSDDPWLTSANNGNLWEMTWVPSGYVFINADVLGGDEYVRLRMLSRDTAGNWDTAADLLAPKETVIILNDTTVTRAYVTHVGTNDQDGVVDPAETKPIQGLGGVNVYGKMLAAGLEEVVQVNVYVVKDPDGAAPDTSLAFIDNSIGEDGLFSGIWDASALPEGEYLLFATAVDIDQNETSKHDATKVRVRIDRTPPDANYSPIGGTVFTASTPYTDDGIVDHSSLAITPDPFTGDVTFTVTTTASDVKSVTLQWRKANDPVGFWRNSDDFFTPTHPASGQFDYEPGRDFVVDGVTYHVWWLHLENFADPANLKITGRLEFRALVVDEAGNSNALQTDVAPYTADNTPPVLFDWNDDSPTDQIEVGTQVHFEISGQDALLDDGTRTDIVSMELFVRLAGSPWPSAPYATVVPEGTQIDTGNAMWIGRFTWTAPDFVVHDSAYEFGVIMIDSAGNRNLTPLTRPGGGPVITVEDNAAPDRTKMIDVVALTYQAVEVEGNPDNPDVWKDNSVTEADKTTYQQFTDWLISEGGDLTPPANGTVGVPVGDSCATFPRNVGESYLNDAQIRNTVKVARTVTLVGRTQAGDDGVGQADTGVQWVTFLLAPCDANGVLSPQADWITLGRDEYRPAFPLFYWHLTFNTTLYADGTYKLAAYAQDEEGNIEDITTLDWTSAIIVIDNQGPSAQMDADSHTDVVEKTATVERNRPFTLFARTLIPGTATLQNYEDDTVEFFYKRGRDLNDPVSWGSVPVNAGADLPEVEDGNPDETRPYSFDVNMGLLTEPTDDETPVPLSVGETYDFVTAVSDEVCNTTTHIETYADSLVAGVGTRYIRILIQDTIAPHLEFTSAVRKAYPCGDENVIENPTKIHAQGFHEITAKLLTGDLDMDHAEFVYRPLGTTTWNLIDAALTSSEGGRKWVLGEWDLQTLTHNTWYEVAAIGVDNVGNVDQNPDIIDVYVDYDAPPFVLVSPSPTTSKWCNGVMDLVVQVDRGVDTQHDDIHDVVWEWKDSTWPDVEAPDNSDPNSEGWHTLGVATEADLYDDATNKYSNTLNLDATVNVDEEDNVPVFTSDLYDLRVTVCDEAGNMSTYTVFKNTVDVTPPNYSQISNIKVDGDDTTQDPSDQGQFTDVTAGSMVEIFGTASDNEPALPDQPDPATGVFYETVIAAMQFQVAFDLNEDGAADGNTWRDIGVVKLDPPNLGDPSAQTSSILWNTTGLPEGQYLLRVISIDECGLGTVSAPVNVRVLDWTPPIARIVAWDSDQQPHGLPAPSLLTIYAMAECDTTDANPETAQWDPTYDVQIQYNVKDANEAVPTGDWVNIGIATPVDTGDHFTTEHLWMATVDPTLFGTDVTSVWLRALVKDEAGNRYGDNPTDIIPTILANVVRQVDDLGVSDGTITLQQVPSAELQGGSEMVQNVSIMVESPTHVIVTTKMAAQDQTPRVVLLYEQAEANVTEYPSNDNPTNLSPGTAVPGGLVRSLDDPTVWRGELDLTQFEECYLYGIWVTGLDGTNATAKWIDLKQAYIREFPVTTALGTNGTVVTPAYGNLGIKVMVPSGSWQDAPACLLVSPTIPPVTSRDQERYLQPVDNTAYHLELREEQEAFVHGYEPLVTIEYSNDLAAAALAQTEGATEADLTVRRWNPNISNRDGTTGAWVGTGISHIKAFPDNNEVTFRVDDLSGGPAQEKELFAAMDSSYTGNVFQLFAPKQTAPVLISNIWPNSPYVADWWTDADPVIVAYLRDPGGQTIDANEVELLIDGEYWATWLNGAGSAAFIRGNGAAWLEYANQDHTVMELVYHHSTFPRDWLTNGAHTLTIRYRGAEGPADWMEVKDFTFNVDRKSPYIEFDGGFMSNPRIGNIQGYMNPQNTKLVAKMFDDGTGILFKHDRPWYYADLDCDGILNPDERQFDPVPFPDSTWLNPGMRGVNCWVRADWSMKYDVWRIHTPDAQPPHDVQHDIDNIEVRTLLHQGTANELEPWIMQNGHHITLDEYNPADTLVVPVPVLGGGMIKDNDIVEITWYSDKSIEQNSDGPGWGCGIDTLVVNGTTFQIWNAGCSYDAESQEMHIYEDGIQDWASNSGSKYVEQRFIVDMSCPTITVLQPATATVDPLGNLRIEVTFDDAGVGVNPASVSVVVLDPSGNVVEVTDWSFSNGRFVGTVVGPLQRGEYTIRVTGADFLGAACEKIQTVKVESLVLAMSEAVAAPNPFNPAEGTAKINFNLSKASDVTIRIYDFAGLEVATLVNMQHRVAGLNTVEWGGEASDHTDLANGAYICRITASDGARTEEQNLKVVIWRE